MRTDMVRGYNNGTQQNQIGFGKFSLKYASRSDSIGALSFPLQNIAEKINKEAKTNGTNKLKIVGELTGDKLKLTIGKGKNAVSKVIENLTTHITDSDILKVITG